MKELLNFLLLLNFTIDYNLATPNERVIMSYDVNSLVEEFQLIQQKKSKLSKMNRDRVVERIVALIDAGVLEVVVEEEESLAAA